MGSSSGRFEDLVAQALRGEIQGKSELIAAIDAISVADVNAVSSLLTNKSNTAQICTIRFNKNKFKLFQAAKKVASGKWSIGAVGNLVNVPHVNDLN